MSRSDSEQANYLALQGTFVNEDRKGWYTPLVIDENPPPLLSVNQVLLKKKKKKKLPEDRPAYMVYASGY